MKPAFGTRVVSRVCAVLGLAVAVAAVGPIPDHQQAVIDVTALAKGQAFDPSTQPKLAQFCCPQYIQTLLENMDWNKRGNKGVTQIQFTIERDGRITRRSWTQRSGVVSQDIEAMRAVQTVRMPPLPQQVADRQLTIRLTFNYGG